MIIQGGIKAHDQRGLMDRFAFMVDDSINDKGGYFLDNWIP